MDIASQDQFLLCEGKVIGEGVEEGVRIVVSNPNLFN